MCTSYPLKPIWFPEKPRGFSNTQMFSKNQNGFSYNQVVVCKTNFNQNFLCVWGDNHSPPHTYASWHLLPLSAIPHAPYVYHGNVWHCQYHQISCPRVACAHGHPVCRQMVVCTQLRPAEVCEVPRPGLKCTQVRTYPMVRAIVDGGDHWARPATKTSFG